MSESEPTIYDVARQCGVAASTVSRAFSNPNRVSAVTRERIRTVAAEIGYTPRPLARSERPARSRTVTLVVTDIANPYYAPLIKAAQAQARERKYTLVLTDSDESPQLEADNLRRVLGATCGGILATSRLSDEVIHQLARHRPLVVVNREIEGIASVIADTGSGMRKAVRHLAALAHRHIAYLSGPRNSWANSARWKAVSEEAAELDIHVSLLGPFAPTRQGGQEAADALTLDGASAAIAYNDLVALGVLLQVTERGIRVPEELSIVGCDDIFGADLTFPGLTTISGPTERLGKHAVEELHRVLSGGAPSRTSVGFETHLVVRGSTGPSDRGSVVAISRRSADRYHSEGS